MVGAALIFLYASVLLKLGRDWLTDENYSHGLLIPFVIAYIIWLEFDELRKVPRNPSILLGVGLICTAFLMLVAGTLGAELYSQRISLLLMLAGILLYWFGPTMFKSLIVPFVLLFLSIPIPQILFNKIALPLQLWASSLAAEGVSFFGIDMTRRGNILELLPLGQSKIVQLEVVEACSGIRSLMTLVALGLILGYLTRDRKGAGLGSLGKWDRWRIAILMASAVPIALITNAARVMGTGVATYYYGVNASEGFWHDVAGWGVFVVAFILMYLLNTMLRSIGPRDGVFEPDAVAAKSGSLQRSNSVYQTAVLVVALVAGGFFVNWFENRAEVEVARVPLIEVPTEIGKWGQTGTDQRFDEASERVLNATEYVMRYYFSNDSYLNFYVGYYESQRTGATYHSPLNCLPGSGWIMDEPRLVEIPVEGGESFTANLYSLQNGEDAQLMLYWYEGRGRRTANEYWDKLYSVSDSFMLRRSDGAMVRLMAPVGENEEFAVSELVDFASAFAAESEPFIPR